MTSRNIELNLNDPNTNDLELEIDASFIGGGGGEYPTYKGQYTVIPKFIEQELETKDKVLERNVEVKEIPVQKAENLGGGYTVTIGG